ncbi:putative zinc finger protein [Archangium gephyra]|uniref:MJ0042 family finger-like protein n=1 Tax=Archangium gephyra TaxID=48 RepID=A0AAC8Q8T5_9BACT|nr:zf-HC2 domain-containing protein [Archangium gephyra]AKJ02676.1 MJ0042 family finger-like protein [Archangium gephyra]REG23221.1 putative zinc finger protein [Archangium gephyra]
MKLQGTHAHEDRLLDFAYDELPPTEARLVEQHVQGCSRCSETLSDIRGVRTTMSRLPLESAPDAGLESLLAYAQQSARRAAAGPEPAPRWWRRLLAPALSVAALGVFGVVVIQVNREVDLSPSLVQQKEAVREKSVRRGEPPEVAAAPAPAEPAAPAPALPSTPVPADVDKVGAMSARPMPKKAPSRKGSGRGVLDEDWSNASAGSAGGFPDKKLALDSETEAGAPAGFVGKVAKSKRDVLGGATLPSLSTAQRAEPAEEPAAEYASANVAEAVQSESAPPAPAQTIRGSASRSAPAASKDVAADDAYEQLAPARAQVASATPPPPPSAPAQYQPSAAAAGPVTRAEGLEARKKEVAQKSEEKAATRYSPSPAELMNQADVAHRSGDWAQEVDFLRAALSAGVRGSQRLEVLSRLCEAEFALGRERIAVQVCKSVMAEAPGSSAARMAQRRLERELPSSADEADSDVKATSPVKK